jgi:hypothetical protein
MKLTFFLPIVLQEGSFQCVCGSGFKMQEASAGHDSDLRSFSRASSRRDGEGLFLSPNLFVLFSCLTAMRLPCTYISWFPDGDNAENDVAVETTSAEGAGDDAAEMECVDIDECESEGESEGEGEGEGEGGICKAVSETCFNNEG